jgi:ATP-binding cassette subfamily B protein
MQAQMDLALPGYLSNIVNVGIQNEGVIENVSKVITEEDMNHILIFSDNEEKEIISNSYDYIGDSKEMYEKYIEEYNILTRNTNIYIIKELSKEDELILFNNLAKNFNIVVNISEKMSSKTNFDFSDIDKDKFSVSTIDQKLFKQANIKTINKYYKTIGIDTKEIQFAYILKTGVIMIIITIAGALSSILVGLFASLIASGVAKNLRRDLFSKVLSFTNNEFDNFSTASLITRSTNDITQVQTVLAMMIRLLFYAPLMGIGGVIKALDKNVSMSWIIALAIIVMLGFILVIFSIALPKFKKIQKMLDKINLITREHLSGMMVIRAFNNQEFEEDRFDKANVKLTSINLFVNRLMGFLFPMMMLIMNLTSVLIIWVGAHSIANSGMQVGDMMAFMQYTMQIIAAFLTLAMMFVMIPRASVSALRIAEVIGTEVSIINPKNPKEFPNFVGADIVFENVYFKYNGAKEYMLKDITFTAKKGETTAIIGSTGSGKTTLVNLISRFYDIDKGQLKVKDRLVNEVKQRELRNLIGYIPQNSMLFSGTIESNLKYGNANASEELLNNAIKIAQAEDFVNKTDDGIKKNISQGGKNISGGQKQRISIARALVKEPEIYIFDDSFSALDYKTDALLRKDLKKITVDKTVIIIAQRISTIKNADQIIVLDDGKIAGHGNHNELLLNCNIYKEIAASQLSKEEL